MDQFEEKLKEELVVIKKKADQMEKDVAMYSDLEKLRADAEAKKQVFAVVHQEWVCEH